MASAVLQVTVLGVFVILSHALPADELGAYRQVLVVQTVASISCALGMQTAMLYGLGKAANGAERAGVYATAFLWMVLCTPLCGALTGALMLAAGHAIHSVLLLESTLPAAVLGAFGVHAIFIGPLLLSERRTQRYLTFALTQTVLLVGLTWIFVGRDHHIQAALAAAAIAAAVGWLVTAFHFRRAAHGAMPGNWKPRLGPAMGYGAPIAAGVSLYTVSYQVDHFVATTLLAPSSYALYAAGAWQLPIGPLIQRAQADVLLPVLARHSSGRRTEEFWSEWRRLIVPWAVFGAILFWAIFPAASDFEQVVLGQRFVASATVLRIYALLLPLQMAAFTLPLRAAGITWLDIVASVAFGVVSLTVGLMLTPRLGLAGPAVGMVSGYAVWIGINIEGTRRMLGAKLTTILPLGQIAASLAVAGAAALPFWAISHLWFPADAAARLICFFVGYGAILGALYLSQAFLIKFAGFVRGFGIGATLRIAARFGRYRFYRAVGPRFVQQRVHSFDMILDLSDPGISRELMIRGDREQQLRELIAETVNEGDAVIDLGANIGYYTLLLAQLVGPEGRVYACEPFPGNFNLLRRNIQLNDSAERVELFPSAGSDHNGMQRLYLAKHSNLHTIGSGKPDVRPSTSGITDEYIEVPAVRLSEFIRGKRPIALLRMDVEGHEVEILRGLRDAIATGAFQGKICFEVHTPTYAPGARDIRVELEFLYAHGYAATVVTSANEEGSPLAARGYRPHRMIRTHGDCVRGFYSNVSRADLLDLVGEVGGIRDVLLERLSGRT